MQPVDKVAKSLVSVILAVSLVAARTNLLWIGNSPLLNYSAGIEKRTQTVWLRRLLLLEVRTHINNDAYGSSMYLSTIPCLLHCFPWNPVTPQFACVVLCTA